MTEDHPLYHLMYGVEGGEWPRWLGHLPWDVKESYKRRVLAARKYVESTDQPKET